VPTDLDGNVLEEPIDDLETKNCDELDKFDNIVVQYQEALDRVVFSGFEVDMRGDGFNDIIILTKDFFKKNKTIEDLVKYNLTLTQQAINNLNK
jgi:hypothetical protein